MTQPRLLDLYAGAGGSARGYQMAGFHVTGIDHVPQPRYAGDVFIKADALEYVAEHGREYDAIHASPPCQAYSTLRVMPNARSYPTLIEATRELLLATERPFVIENVPGAPLLEPIMLCGSQFNLKSGDAGLRRHRLFEVHPRLFALLPPCSHPRSTLGVFGSKVRDIALEKRHYAKPKATRGAPIGVVQPHARGFEAMGIDWMTMDELSEAIPPAYTAWIGEQLMRALTVAA